MFIGSHDFTWLTKLSQHICVAEVIKGVVLKEREGAEWEGVIEECKREQWDLSLKTAEDVGWRFGRPYWRHHSDELEMFLDRTDLSKTVDRHGKEHCHVLPRSSRFLVAVLFERQPVLVERGPVLTENS